MRLREPVEDIRKKCAVCCCMADNHVFLHEDKPVALCEICAGDLREFYTTREVE